MLFRSTLAYFINPALANSKIYILSTILTVFWGATLINFFGMKVSSFVSTIGALLGTLIPMILIMGLGLEWFLSGKNLQIHLGWSAFLPHVHNLNDLAFFTAILFGLIGMEMSAVHADEVKNPGKAYPRALFYSTLIIFITLVCASLAIAVVVPQKQLNILTGLIQAFQIFFRSYGLQ